MIKTIRHANIEITNQCNQKCFYCFNNSGTARSDELSFNTWLRVLKAMMKWGLKSILITGGEPCVRPGIMEFLRKVQMLGLETSILSNGFKLPEFAQTHEEVMKQLKVAQISLDSMNPEMHDARRGVSGAWKQAIDAIESLNDLGVSIEISCTVSYENLDEIPALGSYTKFIGAKLLIRPVSQMGRAVSARIPVDFWQRLKAAIVSLKEDCVKCIHDRFQYVPVSKDIKDKLLNENLFTIEPNGEFRWTSISVCGVSGINNPKNCIKVA